MNCLDTFERNFARLPDEVQGLILQRAREDLLGVTTEDLFETYFETPLGRSPLGRTVLDGAIADRLRSRKDYFPFNRLSSEIVKRKFYHRGIQRRMVMQEDTFMVLLRLAALMVPGSALDKKIQGYLWCIDTVIVNNCLNAVDVDIYRFHEHTLEMLGSMCVDDGSHLRAYVAKLDLAVAKIRQLHDSELLTRVDDGGRPRAYDADLAALIVEIGQRQHAFPSPTLSAICFLEAYSSRYRLCLKIKEILAAWGDLFSGELLGELLSVFLTPSQQGRPDAEAVTEKLVAVVQSEQATAAEKLAAVPAPDVLAQKQRVNACFLRRCFHSCYLWMPVIRDYSTRLDEESDFVWLWGWGRAAAAFLQAAAIEPDDDLAARILKWGETYCSGGNSDWFPPPVVLPARAAGLDRIRERYAEI